MSPSGRVDSLAHGGQGIVRADGRVVFVDGAVPGDVIEWSESETKKRFSRGTVIEVVDASADRIAPPCPVFGRCGGCDWQMMSLDAQRRWKAAIVAGQLSHLGGIAEPPVEATVAVGPGFGYRNRIDVRVSGGRPALLAARSHQPVVIDGCPLVTSPIAALLDHFEPAPDVDRATLRASRTGNESVVLQRRQGRWDRGRIHEEVAGRVFRITDRAFFQVNTPGAAELVRLVGAALPVGPGATMLDGYAGGGLFSATVGNAAGRVIAVENDRAALSDLAVNAPAAEVVASRFEAASLPAVEVAVVDPPRSGLGRGGVDALVGANPEVLAYVSCDPASFARDAALLVRAGYRLDRVTPVDMFPQTHHVELVGVFGR